MVFMTIFSVLLVVSYAGITIWGLRSLPDSISAMVYVLPRQGQWLWTIWLWAVSLCVCIPLIGAMPDGWKALAFITLGCLMLCGAMPISDNNICKRAHDVFGVLGGILSQACVPFLNAWWLMAWFLWLLCMGSTIIQPEGGDMRSLFKGKGVFVAECICFVTPIGALFEYYLTH